MNNIKIIIFVVVFSFFTLGILLFLPNSNSCEINASNYLRIHIRANSNSKVDQEVKYKVKDEIVKVLTPLLCEVKTKDEAVCVIEENMSLITKTANDVLSQNGFGYKSKAGIKSEFFPTRSYENLTLESDVYDALILELGSGLGDNWWCVVYPPMCFINYEDNSSETVEYRFKILEIVKNFFKQ